MDNTNEKYWRERCEAAESVINNITGSTINFNEAMGAWQELKLDPMPPIQTPCGGWIKASEQPLFIKTALGWECTENGEREFLAAVPYFDKKHPNEKLWWIRHCIIQDKIGLCVVTDDDFEVAGWEIEDVVYWMPLPNKPI